LPRQPLRELIIEVAEAQRRQWFDFAPIQFPQLIDELEAPIESSLDFAGAFAAQGMTKHP